MITRTLSAGVIAFAMFGANTFAADLTNLDAKPHTIRIQSVDQEQSYSLMPSEKMNLTEPCQSQCVLVLENGNEYNIVKGNSLFLENGELFVDPPAQGSMSLETESSAPK